eukprot:364819-Chlamydomonas_euryale.AAC.6
MDGTFHVHAHASLIASLVATQCDPDGQRRATPQDVPRGAPGYREGWLLGRDRPDSALDAVDSKLN